MVQKVTTDIAVEMNADYHAGMSMADLTIKYQCSSSTVSKYVTPRGGKTRSIVTIHQITTLVSPPITRNEIEDTHDIIRHSLDSFYVQD